MKRRIPVNILFTVSMAAALIGCAKYKVEIPDTPYQVELGSTLSNNMDEYLSYLQLPTDDEKIIKKITIKTDAIDTGKTGKYTATITYEGQTISMPVEVVDTTAPMATAKQGLSVPNGTEIKASDLLENVAELNSYTVAFVTAEGDKESLAFTTDGDIPVSIKVTDASGNSNTYQANVTIYTPDTEAPAINGVKNLTTTAGTEISLTDGITATDNKDGDLTANITVQGTVDVNTAGDYNITYTVTDNSGNTSSVPAVVTVKAKETVKETATIKSKTTSKSKSTSTEASKTTASTSQTASTGIGTSSTSTASAAAPTGSTAATTDTSQAAASTGTTSSTDTSGTTASSSTSSTSGGTTTGTTYDINNYVLTPEDQAAMEKTIQDAANGTLDPSKQIQFTP